MKTLGVVDLSKKFNDFLAVDNLNFDVEEGEIFGFLGPNGAGKTTTIRMLTGLSQPTNGHSKVLGYDVTKHPTLAKKMIGVVPDLSNLYDELSGLDNLLFMGQLFGLSSAARKHKAESLLRSFRLYDKKDSLFGTYSRGMKRALTIAAALMHEPKILFLDEPTVGLDVIAARSLRNLIAELKKNGVTIFLTTHHLEEADLLCDRIAIIVNGKIIKTDSPENLKRSLSEKPAIDFTFELSDISADEKIKNIFESLSFIKLKQGRYRIFGENVTEVLKIVCDQSDKGRVKILEINTVKPTLEDAFIKITGLDPIRMQVDKAFNIT